MSERFCSRSPRYSVCVSGCVCVCAWLYERAFAARWLLCDDFVCQFCVCLTQTWSFPIVYCTIQHVVVSKPGTIIMHKTSVRKFTTLLVYEFYENSWIVMIRTQILFAMQNKKKSHTRRTHCANCASCTSHFLLLFINSFYIYCSLALCSCRTQCLRELWVAIDSHSNEIHLLMLSYGIDKIALRLTHNASASLRIGNCLSMWHCMADAVI